MKSFLILLGTVAVILFGNACASRCQHMHILDNTGQGDVTIVTQSWSQGGLSGKLTVEYKTSADSTKVLTTWRQKPHSISTWPTNWSGMGPGTTGSSVVLFGGPYDVQFGIGPSHITSGSCGIYTPPTMQSNVPITASQETILKVWYH